MSRYVHKSHNVTVLLYHLVFPAKYRRAVIDGSVDQALREVCLEIETRYQLKFLEIGTDRDHVHFLVQSVPTYLCGPGMRWCGSILKGDGSAFQASQTAWKGVRQRNALRCLAKL